jgi:hypothetical protein
MANKQAKNKPYKNWERHARVILLLQHKQVTVKEMSSSINEHSSHVSACIWGKPSRKNRRIEEKVAEFLEASRDSLFKEGEDEC